MTELNAAGGRRVLCGGYRRTRWIVELVLVQLQTVTKTYAMGSTTVHALRQVDLGIGAVQAEPVDH